MRNDAARDRVNSLKAADCLHGATMAEQMDRSSITIVVDRQIAPSTTSELDPPFLQVGLDRVAATCPPQSFLPFPIQPPEIIPLPRDAGRLVLVGLRHVLPRPRFPWTATAKYVHQPTGHHLRLFFGRSRRYAPHLLVTLWPADTLVFSLWTLLILLNAVSRALKLSLMLSNVEIAADFAAMPMDVHRVASHLWVPRISGHRSVGTPPNATVYWGCPSSAFQVKVYPKHERTLQAIRLEYTLRRKALQCLHVDPPESLIGIDWAAACSRRARLVTVSPDQQRDSALSRASREAFAAGGIFAVRERVGTRGMRWLGRHIASSPMQHALEAALAVFGRLPGGAPDRTEQAHGVDPDAVALRRAAGDDASVLAPLLCPGAKLLTENEILTGHSMRPAEVIVAGSSD